jgi:hypothetical protein
MDAARPYAVDFHVHTPISRCHEVEDWSTGDFLNAATAAGLDAVAITDHHSADNAWELHAQSQELRVTVLPGMELTTRDGHLLVLFDPQLGSRASEDLLSTVALPHTERGNGSFLLRIPMVEAVQAAVALGALAIPAHVDRWPNGFLEKQISFRVREAIVMHSLVTAMEITLPSTQRQWETGCMPPYAKPLACVRGSDSHGLKEVGRRPTWLLAGGTDFASVRLAVMAPGATSFERKCDGKAS